MRNDFYKVVGSITIGLLLPQLSFAQGLAGEVRSLHTVLTDLYNDMLPLCSKLIGVGRGLAGFAALWYIASRVWRHLANAESIDFYPLLRPFALGLCIMMFPTVIRILNGILQPTVTGTAAMVDGSSRAIEYLLKMKEDAIQKSPTWQMYVGEGGDGNYDKWYQYTHPEGEDENLLEQIDNGFRFDMARMSYQFKNTIKQWMSEILQIIFEASALAINTIRTFYLLVLAILGPLVFGFAVFDGLQNTLTAWLARYINVFLWLPVANIFGSIIGKIQENMLRIDIQQVQTYGDTFFSSTDTAYLIFLVIGIIGYFTVPSVANYIVHAGGANTLLHKSTNLFSTTAIGATAAVGSAAHTAISYLNSPSPPPQNNNNQTSEDYQHNKLSGKT